MCSKYYYLVAYRNDPDPIGLWDCEVMPEWAFLMKFKADRTRILYRLASSAENNRYRLLFQENRPIKFDLVPYHFVGDAFNKEAQ